MPQIRVGDRTIELDSSGFLLQLVDWDSEVAEVLAQRVSLAPLSEEHWRVIRYVREYHAQHRVAPPIRAIAKRTRLRVSRLNELFPSSCRECMCLVAGLPQPTG